MGIHLLETLEGRALKKYRMTDVVAFPNFFDNLAENSGFWNISSALCCFWLEFSADVGVLLCLPAWCSSYARRLVVGCSGVWNVKQLFKQP